MQAILILVLGSIGPIADVDDALSFLEAIASQLVDASDFFIRRFSDVV